MKKIILIIIVFCSIISNLYSKDELGIKKPREGARVFTTDLSVWYISPILGKLGQGDDTYGLYDNFSIGGSLLNLIHEGPNLNIFYGINHVIAPNIIIPKDNSTVKDFKLANQSSDIAYLQTVFSPTAFFSLNFSGEYLKNKIIEDNVDNPDYSYDSLNIGTELILDQRYSFLEPWYRGVPFKYGQDGYLIGLGYNSVFIKEDENNTEYNANYISLRMEKIKPLNDYWGIFMGVKGKSYFEHYIHRAIAMKSTVIGTTPFAGDFTADARAELRFFYPGGLYFNTPALGVSSFLFKLSPGCLVGYNGGITGLIDNDSAFQHSGYITPILALRFEGNLMVVCRFDMSLSSSDGTNLSFSINFGMFDGDITSLVRFGGTND